MSTNHGRVDGPEDKDRTTAPSGDGIPTEPIADSHPTEPIRGVNPTEPIHDAHRTGLGRPEGRSAPTHTEPGTQVPSGATVAGPTGWDDHASSSDWHTTAFPESRDNDRDDDWENPNDSTKPARPRRRPRAGTIVWGLFVIALAVVLILAEVPTLNLDMGQVIIGLLIGAGLALVIGGVISAGNREKDDKRP
ncbi:MAG TPA: hypothetical protein VFI97_04300 [Arthrobacter sp.]|nr:hypothetical protein [Arthrobacter sp.]